MLAKDTHLCKAQVQQSLQPCCDLSTTEKNGNCRGVAEVGARFYKGLNEVTARSQMKISRGQSLSMHIRLAATDFEVVRAKAMTMKITMEIQTPGSDDESQLS